MHWAAVAARMDLEFYSARFPYVVGCIRIVLFLKFRCRRAAVRHELLRVALPARSVQRVP
jgi:hypothetical protein